MLSCSGPRPRGPAHTASPTLTLRSQPETKDKLCVLPHTEPGRTQTQPSTHWHSRSSLCFSLVGDNKQSFILPLGRRVQRKDGNQRRSRAPLTWSNSCFPVVLGWMANSSSASMVVTRTLICREGQRAMRNNLLIEPVYVI